MASALGLLASSYGDEEEEEVAPAPIEPPRTLAINAAPAVMDGAPSAHNDDAWGAMAGVKEDRKQGQTVLYHNPEHHAMYAPDQGPAALPHGIKSKTRVSSAVEPYHPSSNFAFEEQYHTFNAYGFAADPSTGSSHAHLADGRGPVAAGVPGVVGDMERWAEARGATIFSSRGPLESRMEEQRKRLRLDESYAPIPAAQPELTAEQAASIAAGHKKAKAAREGRGGEEDQAPMEETSVFHGKDMRDYQGRSWVEPPRDVRNEEHECFIPKRCIHTWSGHTKGVAAIRWFPGNGHLLLSAGMDTKVKIWDVFNSRKCMRTYMGHAAAVRDICFSNDGRRFVTCSYDRYLKLWDTETGECISAFTNKKLPYCVKLNPDDDKQNVIMAGCSNKHIVQYDANSGKVEQVYDQHLGAVNTITFCEENRRFATTADDKKMLIWEFGIPVPIKHIADPTQHSMPAVTKTPNDKWMLCQNLDNQITTYSASDRFKLNRKKLFKGHVVAGYACQPGVSPDGNFVMSGDTDGRLWFWDWKSCKVFRKIQCHDQVLIQALWHPVEASRVATCSWDGTIKYWD